MDKNPEPIPEGEPAEPKPLPEGMTLKELPPHIRRQIEANQKKQAARQERAVEDIPEAEHKRVMRRIRNLGLLIDRVAMRAWPLERLEQYLALVNDGSSPGAALDQIQKEVMPG